MSFYDRYPVSAAPYHDAAALTAFDTACSTSTQGQAGSLAPSGNSYLELGKFGATVGLCGAAAANLRRLQSTEINATQALFDSLRTGVAAGLATAAAGYVANQFRSPTTMLAATLITGTAVMYVLNTEAQSRSAGLKPEGDES